MLCPVWREILFRCWNEMCLIWMFVEAFLTYGATFWSKGSLIEACKEEECFVQVECCSDFSIHCCLECQISRWVRSSGYLKMWEVSLVCEIKNGLRLLQETSFAINQFSVCKKMSWLNWRTVWLDLKYFSLEESSLVIFCRKGADEFWILAQEVCWRHQDHGLEETVECSSRFKTLIIRLWWFGRGEFIIKKFGVWYYKVKLKSGFAGTTWLIAGSVFEDDCDLKNSDSVILPFDGFESKI